MPQTRAGTTCGRVPIEGVGACPSSVPGGEQQVPHIRPIRKFFELARWASLAKNARGAERLATAEMFGSCRIMTIKPAFICGHRRRLTDSARMFSSGDIDTSVHFSARCFEETGKVFPKGDDEFRLTSVQSSEKYVIESSDMHLNQIHTFHFMHHSTPHLHAFLSRVVHRLLRAVALHPSSACLTMASTICES
ncbi:uncharacterized protein SCHCODRAFT_02195900 [Schizophyllum commune H4-8]|uniref:uncharacterized protein n=1 Tax=Schizophyllum commune (strain H4-8 / FGSC 9210) TaxID=578458 RepID=UPI002160C83F|nr:uncharacterized protein SCHCODRAFT_02195900 [Schizophyllum commune H4-8]KAI5896643.1 hypothetical protein SCHCODRAFT_02195900 [Schizophyllum commune H4-8]